MKDVDFAYIGDVGCTIYKVCFQQYVNAVNTEMREEEKSKLALKTEEVFFFLVEQGKKNRYNVDAILEIPDSNGGTCFKIAALCSWNIMLYIIKRGIKVNSIRSDMTNWSAAFNHFDFLIQVMKKGINPYVINYEGDSGISMYPSNFENDEAKSLLSSFSRSIHFSIEDIECEQSCPADCPSKFERFYYKNGPLVEMTEENRIGKGGFGMVYKQLFHGKPMAMKCILVKELKDPEERDNGVQTAVVFLEKNISELRIQIATAGSGVIVPVAFVRQQNQEQDQDGKWIAKNYNIYIYPLYHCNLYELHTNYFDQFTEEIVADIIHQCFIRIGSFKSFHS